MSSVASGIKSKTSTYESTSLTSADKAEELLHTIDESTMQSTGVSLLHILTLGSIGASIALFFAGKKQTAIFIGLWPPTFQALKAAVDAKKT